jgi:inhibitor of KinA sporulation pathway (predicted exonuclease)
MDLEWNDAYCKKVGGFVNEIVEIGAIKLDQSFNEIDRFSIIVRSAITNRLSTRFKELTGMTNEQMQEGIPFAEALEKYKKWAGDNTITLTWSNSDLHTLYHNCVNFIGDSKAAEIGEYVDLQKYFQYELSLKGKTEKNQISLANAAILFDIDFENESLHHALDDSVIAAAILRKCYVKEHFEKFVINTSDNEFYKRMMYKVRYIDDINNPAINKEQLNISCPKCKKRAKRISVWRLKKPWFHSSFICNDCNFKFKAAVALKKFYDRVEVKKKVFEPSIKSYASKNTNVQSKSKNSAVKTK